MAAVTTQTGRQARPVAQWFGVRTPGSLLLFFASSILSLSLIFQADPEHPAVLAAHGWGYQPHFWDGELWRLVVNQLLHTKLWHFACNAYWFLLFSPVLEEILGTRRFLLQMFLAAWVVGLAGNLSWEAGGIGLSGLLYFQFGCLVVLARGNPAAARVCDRPTRWLLWGSLLVLGPGLTLAGLVQVGNVVHLSGCLFGLLAGWLLCARPQSSLRLRRAAWAALSIPLAAASVLLHAPFWDPDWHYWRAFNSKDIQVQLHHYRKALQLDPRNPHTLYNLGLVHFEQGALREAEQCWLRCVALDPENAQVCQALFSLYAQQGDASGMERWGGRLARLTALN